MLHLGLDSLRAIVLHLGLDSLRAMALVTIAYSGQAVFCVARERRRLWSSRPSRTIVL